MLICLAPKHWKEAAFLGISLTALNIVGWPMAVYIVIKIYRLSQAEWEAKAAGTTTKVTPLDGEDNEQMQMDVNQSEIQMNNNKNYKK